MKVKNETFERTEIKYQLSGEIIGEFLHEIQGYIHPDAYFDYAIYNYYLDNDQDELIYTSLQKPTYKEKVRIRSYQPFQNSDHVFFEIKKKFQDTVFKRRVDTTLTQIQSYFKTHQYPDNQIWKELDYVISRYQVYPKLFLSYERCAYQANENSEIRITFDRNIQYQYLDKLMPIKSLFEDSSTRLLELKLEGNMPIWLSKALSKYQIYPTSFSKYGAIYKKEFSI